MKKINILYWTFTGIFAAFMFLSGIQNALVTPESVEVLMTKLGYPQYIIPFLGVAKCMGAIATCTVEQNIHHHKNLKHDNHTRYIYLQAR